MNNLPTWWTLWIAFIVLIATLHLLVPVVRITIRIMRDGWRVTWETDEQRYQRRMRERMALWAERDRQRQRFLMATRRRVGMPHRRLYPSGNLARHAASPPDCARRLPNTADPSLTQEDWNKYLTTE
jgi:hypothetical protein